MNSIHFETMDCITVLRVAGKVPPAMEELRTKTEYQPANDPLGFPQAIAQKIVNRLLDILSIESFAESLAYVFPMAVKVVP
jgi:hypothetical protein